MYSEKFKTIFVHVPKTGGQSIEHVFIAEQGLTWETRAPLLLRRKTKGETGPKRLAHLFAREYVPFGYVTQDDFAGSFKFAIVRNPYARAISEYRYRIVEKVSARDLTFRKYVTSLETDALTRHDVPQSDFVLDESGAMIVDEILRHENLAADFADVSRRIFGRAIELPHANKSTGAMPADAEDVGLKRILHRFYERDFDLFKYPGGF